VKVRVEVFNADQYDGDWPTEKCPAKLADAIQWFQGKLEVIPPEFRDSATCEIGSTSGYEDSHYGHIEIWYERPETAEERAARRADRKAKDAAKTELELATLRELQAKYGIVEGL
jgi:hypothetical protein